MKKTLRLWMLLVVTLNIVSCTEVMDFISRYIY